MFFNFVLLEDLKRLIFLQVDKSISNESTKGYRNRRLIFGEEYFFFGVIIFFGNSIFVDFFFHGGCSKQRMSSAEEDCTHPTWCGPDLVTHPFVSESCTNVRNRRIVWMR